MSVWSNAEEKRKNRRAEGLAHGAAAHAANAQLAALIAAANGVVGAAAAGNTQSTMVVARYIPDGTYYGVGIPVMHRTGLNAAFGIGANDMIIRGYSTDANLHAEMKVVRKVCEDKGENKGSLGGNLVIACIGKEVCADCCGWLTRYNINHGGTHNCSREGSNMGWRHPLTNANFRGEKEGQLQYTKSSKYVGTATAFNPNPKMKNTGEKRGL